MHRRKLTRLMAASAVLLAPAGLLDLTTAPASAGQVGVTIGIEGAGTVTVVEGSLEDGGSTICTSDNQDHRVTVWCGRVRDEEPLEAWIWLRPTPSVTPADQWTFAGWSGCDTTRSVGGVTECAVHSTAFGSVEKTPVAHFRDVVGPTVSGILVTPLATGERTFRFEWSAAGGTSQCRLEGQPSYTSCVAPAVLQLPDQGVRKFQVRVTDPSGNVASAEVPFTSVDTAINAGPDRLSNSSSPSFYLATEAGEEFMCSLDDATFTPCGTGPRGTVTLSGVTDGPHRFRAYARTGNWKDMVPAVWWWSVDTTPPGPTRLEAEDVTADHATFTFDNLNADTYRCRHQTPTTAGMWWECASPLQLEGLEEGTHTLTVQAVDPFSNIESPGQTYRWTVDTVAPATTLTPTTSYDTATFTFAAPGAVRFECRLTGPAGTPAWAACSSPLTYSTLSAGDHLLEVRAVDAAGNIEDPPVSHRWTATPDSVASPPGPGPTPAPGPMIDPAPAPQTGKLVSTTAARWTVARGTRNRVVVAVVASTAPTGRIQIRDRGKVIARARLLRSHRGRIVVKLPKLRGGTHKLVAVYLGSAEVATSRSRQRTIKVPSHGPLPARDMRLPGAPPHPHSTAPPLPGRTAARHTPAEPRLAQVLALAG